MNFSWQVALGAVVGFLLNWAFHAFVDWLLRQRERGSVEDADPVIMPWQYDPAVGQYLPPEECDYDSLRNNRHA
jgi:hypothetical protein